jgi:8-oxo-dGTP pyrophosphatase MutT (NUDIX family)
MEHGGFPGGHIEGGESFEGCAIRETEEETGIMLAEARLWTVENTIFHTEKKALCCSLFGRQHATRTSSTYN